jgi:pilus assembly protein FimV
VLRDKLAVAEEAADAAKLQTEDLKAKVGDLQQVTEQTNAILKLKDDQIAALQSRLAEMEAEMARIREERAAAAASSQAAGTAVVPEISADGGATAADSSQVPSAQDGATNSGEPAAAPPVASPEVSAVDAVTSAEPVSAVEPTASVEPSTPVEPAPPVDYNTASEPGVAVTDVQQAALLEAPVTPADSSSLPTKPESLLDQVLASPLMMAGVGGGVLALIAGLFLALRRGKAQTVPSRESKADIKLPPKSKVAKPAALSGASTQAVASVPVATPEPAPAPSLTEKKSDPLDTLSDNMFKQELTPVLGGSPSAETVSQTADVVGEADIYIAYGRFPQAIEMLERALTVDPDRSDVMLKLIEVAAESRDRQLFDRYAPALLGKGDRAIAHKVNAFEAQLPAREVDLGLDVAVDELSLDDIPVPSSTTTSSDLPPLEFDTVSFDSAPAGPAASAPVPEAGSVPASVSTPELPDLDFGLDDSKPETPVEDSIDDASFEFDAGIEPVATIDASPGLTVGVVDEVVELDFAGVEDDIVPMPEPAVVEVADTTNDYAGLDAGDLSFELEPAGELDVVEVADEPVVRPAAFAVEEGDLQFSADGDEVATKLDLARAYIDMGDRDGARDILDEVLLEGTTGQRAEAKELLSRL